MIYTSAEWFAILDAFFTNGWYILAHLILTCCIFQSIFLAWAKIKWRRVPTEDTFFLALASIMATMVSTFIVVIAPIAIPAIVSLLILVVVFFLISRISNR